eukprot:1987852-Alexandrium_andersonii.AAC.1
MKKGCSALALVDDFADAGENDAQQHHRPYVAPHPKAAHRLLDVPDQLLLDAGLALAQREGTRPDLRGAERAVAP